MTQVASPSGADTYAWDKNGNQLSDGKNLDEYDGLKRLTALETPSERVAYQYDGDGLLTSRSTEAASTTFYWNGEHVVNEGDGAGNITASLFHGGGRYVGRQVGTGQMAYYLYASGIC